LILVQALTDDELLYCPSLRPHIINRASHY